MMMLKQLMRSPAVLSIIAIQIVVYIAQLVNHDVAERLSLPGDVEGLGERPWSPLTVMFVHELLVHVVLMVVMLAAFGPLLEQSARAMDLIAVYLLAGLAGSLGILAAIAAVPAWAEDGTIVGSSAAVFGVTAAVLAMRPSSRLFGGTTTQWLGFLIAANIVFFFSLPLGSVGHLVGIAVGWAYGRWLRTRFGSHAEEVT
ncbi:rhomboid family intramembrane serine protease [Nesterenkonia sp. LB17]|uniref:rhomboid family intramembrane serine protease n=1 Tax=Nesterenkonia sp. LB17 TaxID=2901230 RepID=UPI001F4C69B9|nr:rhomboid family intramembrane serine protease [Nesterenkonia sp. LB17]MCH8565219.1 rhomboid family intramembrane serine protease [Nesterenkonia sp. LB17]